jgi:lysophospholipase L1-like esterase
MSEIKTIAKNSAVLLAGCLLALCLLEALLRLFPPMEIRFKPDRIVLPVNKRYILDNRVKFPRLDQTTIHTKNALGFRGAPPPRDFGSFLTMVTVGGSTTECFYLSDGQTWPDLLGRELSAPFKKVWINNAGLDGATSYRHILLMEDYVAKLRPKVVLFLMGVNDVGQGDIGLKKDKISAVSHFLRSVGNHSEVYSLGQNIYRYFIAQSRGLHHVEIDFKRVGSLDHIPESRARAELAHQRRDCLPFYADRVAKLIHICRSNGIEPVLITQPALYGRGVDPRTGVDLEKIKLDGGLNGALMWTTLELYNQVLRDAARREQVLLIDLAAELPKNSEYFYDYLHYTDTGAARVAGIVAAGLEPFLAEKFPAFKQ